MNNWGIRIRGLIITILALVLMFTFVGSVYADDDTDLERKSEVEKFIVATCPVQSGKVKYINGTVKAYVSEEADELHTVQITLNDGKTVLYYNPSGVDILYRQAVKYNESGKVGEKVSDITNNMNIEADTGGAAIMLSGFKPILELAIGVLVVLIIFGMALFTSLDVCYIALPIFRNKAEEVRQSGSSWATSKTSNGDVKLRWITDDAQYAISEGTIDSGKSPWKLYFKRRITSYIFLGIILFVLLTGNISIITDIAINAIAGIMDILSGLAS